MKTDDETLAIAARMRREPDRAGSELSTADVAAAGRGVPVDDPAREAGERGNDDARSRLVPEDTMVDYRARWQDVQADFVDDPRWAVERGDALVAELMQRLAETLADERTGLERQWSGGGEPSTEELRVAIQRYRSFFERLLNL